MVQGSGYTLANKGHDIRHRNIQHTVRWAKGAYAVAAHRNDPWRGAFVHKQH
jgi:hypothetical protein